MLASQLPPNKFFVPFANSAGTGYINVIPLTTTTVGAASLEAGFPPICFVATAAGGKPPSGGDVNGIINEATAWAQWQQAGGLVPYDSAFSSAIGGYPQGAVLQSASGPGLIWVSKIDNNTYDPDTDNGAHWFACDLVPLYATDTGSANSINITLTPGFASMNFYYGRPIAVQKSGATNSGPVQVTLNGFGPFNLTHADFSVLRAGELPASSWMLFTWDNTRFQLQSIANPGSAATRSASNPALSEVASVTPGTAGNLTQFQSDGASIQDAGTSVSAIDAAIAAVAADIPSASTDGQMETGTDTTTFVTPGRLMFSPSAVKASGEFDSAGLEGSTAWNISSITYTGSGGNYTVQLSGGLNYASGWLGFSGIDALGNPMFGTGTAKVTGLNPTVTLRIFNANGNASTIGEGQVWVIGKTSN